MTTIDVDTQAVLGPLEVWRHSVGHGGINSLPLPDRVVAGAAKLGPRLIRIFLQEFFSIYPDHGRFDWSKLDPYMDAFARTGAKLVAAITIKPSVLYPDIDHSLWQPRDVQEWQHVIGALVRRYSVEKPIVTHWEIGNEVDIGEDGGCPYRIPDPQAYAEYYTTTVQPILDAFPQARVGGPAMAAMHAEPLPGFLLHCQQTRMQLDFLSWHLYHSDPGRHGYQAQIARLLAADLPRRPELMVTEWSGFPSAWNRGENADATEDRAFDLRRAALAAAAIIEMHRAGLNWSFYYHLWDQICYPEDFAPFFSPRGVANMVRHWNELPHRLGLFGVSGEVRPQYFVYLMLSRLGEEQVAASSNDIAVRVLAGRSPRGIAVLAVNHSLDEQRDRVVTLCFSNLQPGAKQLTAHRIDGQRRWDGEALELLPVEQRGTYTQRDYACQVWLPANSVALVSLNDQ
jgi:xylan 1,4-beta-xylosidase